MALCEVCLEDAPLACSVCKVTRYCSPECQKVDWKIHKKACKMNQILNEFNAKHAAERAKEVPAEGRCTGCNQEFDDEDYFCDQECEDCGYQTCESCSSHHSRGTCWCPKSNFGRRYCEMEPRWYHADGRTGASYRDDRHPELDEEYPEEAFELEPRACGNCGEVKRVLKQEYCN